jgi:hypothetical protein
MEEGEGLGGGLASDGAVRAPAAKTVKTMRMLRSMHEAILRQGIMLELLSKSRSEKRREVLIWVEEAESAEGGGAKRRGSVVARLADLTLCVSSGGLKSGKPKGLLSCLQTSSVERIAFSSITDMSKGHKTEGFRASTIRMLPAQCMSIHHASGVLDLQAVDANVVVFLFETLKKQLPALASTKRYIARPPPLP